jgi:hypothetical protein
MSDPVTASIRYVQRSTLPAPSEKGYILHYAAPPNFPQNNFNITSYPNIKIHNLRTANLSYASHGMKLATLDNSAAMTPDKFDDDDWIEQVYLPELHRCLCKTLGARDVTIFDWMLRKRAASFPKRSVGEENEGAAQPSLSVHIGMCAGLFCGWMLMA